MAEIDQTNARENAHSEALYGQLQGSTGWWLVESTSKSSAGAEGRLRRAIPMTRTDVEERDSRVLLGWTYDARSAVEWANKGTFGPLCVYHSIPAEG